MLAVVKQSSNRLLNTLSDYIDMARIVSGTMKVSKNEFHLQPFFVDVIDKAKKLCDSKQLRLKAVFHSTKADLSLYSDPLLIKKILNYLLDNAIKFTEKGSIKCGYKLKNGFLEFFVKDSGPGITHEKLDEIFKIFTQEEVSNTRGYEGSGLGLSIARGLVQLLGGSISVNSEKGKGATFTFTVPCNVTEIVDKTSQSEERSVISPGKPLVLLAEDDESNYLYMEEVLQQAGCDYLLAKNGEKAVALCKQHPEISLVLMDIKMPVMDGVEATSRIRDFRPGVPIIATTAYAQTGDEQRFLAAGCDGYLPKPISIDKLMTLLSTHLKS